MTRSAGAMILGQTPEATTLDPGSNLDEDCRRGKGHQLNQPSGGEDTDTFVCVFYNGRV